MKVKSESEVAQLCPTLSDPMDCSLPGSSIHGIFQARILEWGAIAFSEISDSVLNFFFNAVIFFNGGPKSIAESPVYKCSLRFLKNFTKKSELLLHLQIEVVVMKSEMGMPSKS